LLMDFGLATDKPTCYEWGCGSRFYMSPEIYGVNREPYDSAKADIWALGIILVNLVTGRNPWRKAVTGDNVYDSFCRDPDALMSILPISTQMNHLLRRIFVEPRLRPSIASIREEVNNIDAFLQIEDLSELQTWQETLDRDRDALLNQQDIELHAEPLLPASPNPATANPGTANPASPNPAIVKAPCPQRRAITKRKAHEAAAAVDYPAARQTSLEIPHKVAHVFDWRQAVAAEAEDYENPARFDEGAPSWSSGLSPRNSPARPRRARELVDSASTDSRPFPITPQMPNSFDAPAIAAALSPSQAQRRGSIRRKLFRNSQLFDSDEPAEELPADINMDILADDEPESNQRTLGQKMKHLMHRSARYLNSRAVPEPIDD